MNYQIELFRSMLNEFLIGESALVTLDGEVLGLRGENPVSYGTLTTAAKVATQYLRLEEGDIALLNDPYSGGTTLSEFTFVIAVSEDLLWIHRRKLDETVKLAKSIEDEGLRIPPMPLLQKGKTNELMLAAMQAHPNCPPHLVDWLLMQSAELSVLAKKLVDALEFTGFTITGELVEEFLELSKKTAMRKISERAYGESRVDVHLDSGELLRMSLKIQDGLLALDFGGTSASQSVSLTESATFGSCYYALSRFYGFDEIANSGSLSVLTLTKPSNCWLGAKYPAPTFKGMICGVAALKTAMEQALSQIHKINDRSASQNCPVLFDLSLSGSHALLTLHGGKGASSQKPGASAQTNTFSVEQLERDFPVKVLTVDYRKTDSQEGKFGGGAGLLLQLEIQGEIKGTWLTDLTKHRPRLSKKCSLGESSSISIEQKNGTTELPALGEQIFKAGDLITIYSGSGGGYG